MSPVCIIHYTMHIICNMYSLVMIVDGISVQLSSSSALGNRVYVSDVGMDVNELPIVFKFYRVFIRRFVCCQFFEFMITFNHSLVMSMNNCYFERFCRDPRLSCSTILVFFIIFIPRRSILFTNKIDSSEDDFFS